jgi:hypothetical protein
MIINNPDFSTIVLPTPVNRIGLEDGARNARDQLLKDNVDTINPIRYAALTAEQQAELAAYRTALLNVPQQTGWPRDIEWPTKPSWL